MDSNVSLRVPKLCHHRASGKAVVRLDGRDYYCGPWRTKAAEAEYDRLVAVFLAGGRRMPRDAEERGALTVTELIDQYWRYARGYYRRPDGKPSSEVSCIKVAITELRRLAGELPAREFGPLRLKALQDAMIANGWARRSINLHIGRVRRVFAWGVQNELLPVDVLMALKALPGLKAGRCDAHETEPVRPVADDVVKKTLPFLTPPIAALVKIMSLSGMRVSEAATMRMQDLDRSGETWEYRPATHKTAWRGRGRVVALGPQAQEVLRPFLRAAPGAFLFQPAEGDALYRRKRRKERKTPLRPVDMRREDAVVATSERRFGARYDKNSIGHAIRRACKKAGVADWHAHQLRHAVATRLQRTHGLDAARAVLGHATADVTMIYAERDNTAVKNIMSAEG